MHEELFERTRCKILRHLQNLNGQVSEDGGRIRDPEVLDGIKDCVRTLHWLSEVEAGTHAARAAGKL